MEEETLQSAEAGAVHAVAGRGIYGSLLDLPSEQVLHAGRSTALLRLIGLAERRVGGRRISTGSLEVEQLTQPLRVWTLRAGAVGFNSRVTPFIHEASRNIRIFSVSCRSVMNFVRESFFAGPMRNSGSVWRRAFATTNSDGGTPGRMVRSQEPNESQTSLGATTARYWSSPWATTPACMKA